MNKFNWNTETIKKVNAALLKQANNVNETLATIEDKIEYGDNGIASFTDENGKAFTIDMNEKPAETEKETTVKPTEVVKQVPAKKETTKPAPKTTTPTAVKTSKPTATKAATKTGKTK